MSTEYQNPKHTDSSVPEASPQSANPAGPSKLGLILFLVVIVAGGVIFGVVSLRGPDDDSPHQNAGDPSPPDSTHIDAQIRTDKGSSWKKIDDPSKDGWDTEAFAANAKKQLEALGNLLVAPDSIDDPAVEKLIRPDFICEPLRPSNLVAVLDDQFLKIERPGTVSLGQSSNEQSPENEDQSLNGAGGLAKAMRKMVEPFSDATNVRFEAKIFRVVAQEGEVLTRQYFSISGQTKSGMIEQHATWDIGWAPSESDGDKKVLPRMRWLRVEEFEQTASRQPSGPLFADCTASVLGGNQIYKDQFLHGMNHWFQRIQDPSRFALFGNPGVAVGDVNGDGLDDLYVCQEAGLPNRLFIQNADGTASDASTSWGVDWLESSRSALLVDLDNDSDQDLVVAILGGVVVAENDGQGRFHLRAVLPTVEDTMSLSAVDYDMDGRLDIYVCGYYANRKFGGGDAVGLPGAAADFILHDANDGGSNSLFHNQIAADGTDEKNRKWRFTDVTEQVGLNVNNHRYSLAASWDDFDNDGDLDLYVANDYGRDHFYRNDFHRSVPAKTKPQTTRQFVDISDSAQVENSAGGMSITWSDYDRDGWMDVLVSNMWSSAGKRITYQSQFKPDAPPEIKRRYQRFARGNTLLRNRGDNTFDDRSEPTGIEMGRWAWGSHFVDVNNDGWEDLVVSNGYLTTEDSGDL
jgi:hypothetical protein